MEDTKTKHSQDLESNSGYVNNVKIPDAMCEQEEIVDEVKTGKWILVPIQKTSEAEYNARVRQDMFAPERI